MTRQSDAIKAVAEKIRKALPPTPDTATQALLDELEQASRRYLEQGRLLRIDMLKRLPPEEDGIAWLKAQGKGYQTRMNAILRQEMLRDLLHQG